MIEADSSIRSYLYSNNHAHCATLAEAKWMSIFQGSTLFAFRESDSEKARQLSEAIVQIMQTPAYTNLQHEQLYVGDTCGSEFAQIDDTTPVSLYGMSGLFALAGLLATFAVGLAVVQRHCHRSEDPLVERIEDVPAHLELTFLATRQSTVTSMRPSFVTSMRPSIVNPAANPGRRSLPTSPEVETLRASLAQVNEKVDALTEAVYRQHESSGCSSERQASVSPASAGRQENDRPKAANNV